MSEQAFDSLTYRASAAVSRRGSVLTLATAALATVARPGIATAGKSGKKARKKCKKQVGTCRTVVVNVCSNGSDPQQCEAEFLPCCQFLARCNGTAFLDCIVAT